MAFRVVYQFPIADGAAPPVFARAAGGACRDRPLGSAAYPACLRSGSDGHEPGRAQMDRRWFAPLEFGSL